MLWKKPGDIIEHSLSRDFFENKNLCNLPTLTIILTPSHTETFWKTPIDKRPEITGYFWSTQFLGKIFLNLLHFQFLIWLFWVTFYIISLYIIIQCASNKNLHQYSFQACHVVKKSPEKKVEITAQVLSSIQQDQYLKNNLAPFSNFKTISLQYSKIEYCKKIAL